MAYDTQHSHFTIIYNDRPTKHTSYLYSGNQTRVSQLLKNGMHSQTYHENLAISKISVGSKRLIIGKTDNWISQMNLLPLLDYNLHRVKRPHRHLELQSAIELSYDHNCLS